MDDGMFASMLRSPFRRQLEVPHRGKLSEQRPTVHPEGSGVATDTLYITPAEQKLWGQLMGILSPALWEGEASGSLQGESGVISFSGPREVILRAKEAVSKLLILVGSMAKISRMVLPQTEQRAAGFFHLSKGLDLLLWEGEASRFRVDATVRISPKGDLGCGSAVFAERVLSHRGSPCTNFNVFLSCAQTVELGAGAVKLALEAASQKGLQSLTMTCTDPISSTYQAEAAAPGIEAFMKDHPASPLKTIHFVSSDRDAVAAFHRQCEERWPPGAGHRDQLRSMLMSLEDVKAEVISGYSAKQKTDVVVVPLVLEPDGMGWGPDSLAITQRALKIVPQAVNLLPEEILSVTASAFPEFDCQELYVVRLAWSQAVRKMVRTCLSAFYGSFLESISFPLVQPADSGLGRKERWLLIVLEEIDRFMKEFPNPWMKRVQVVLPPGQGAPYQERDSINTARELVGVCHLEDPLFFSYLKESPDSFHQFKMQLKEVGCGIQIFSSRGVLIFRAMGPSVELYDLGAAFQSMRDKYLIHCETKTEMVEALLENQTLLNEFKSIRTFLKDRLWFVGLRDEMASFLHCLFREVFRRQLVSQECLAGPLCRCAVAKDILVQEILKSDILVTIELLIRDPPTVRFAGRRHRVEEAERRFKELIGSFQAWPVPLSNFQSQFVKAQWGNLFHGYFFLEQGIPSVLEISEVVQVAGVDLDKMKEAEELFLKYVCERTVEIPEEMNWVTMCDDWKGLLQKLGSHKEIVLHQTTSTQVTIVGICPHVTQVEQCIQEYLWDNFPVKESITSDRLELVAAQQNLLCIMRWKHLKVRVQVLLDSEILILLVSGLRKFVQKAIPVISKDLDSLVVGKMPLRERSLASYFFGAGSSVLQKMAFQQHCVVATMQTQEIFEFSDRTTNSNGNEWPGISKKLVWGINALGKENDVALLKLDVNGFAAEFCERDICSEAIATFSSQFLKELCHSKSLKYPIDFRHLKDINQLQIHGIREDVENVLKTIHAKIEEYQAERIEVMAQYEKVPHVFIEEFLAHGVLPADPSASSEILAGNPAAVVFRGTRQNVVELERRFKDLLSCFQVLPVSLTDLQSRFVKARWGSLFHKNFFWEQGIAALLEISGDVQVSGLDLGTVKKAEGFLSKHVCEKTLEIPEEVKWATECEEWQDLLHRLESHQVALYNTLSSLVFMVGICPHITQAEQSMKEYLEDHSQVEERLNVARPKLALAGENLLHIMDWDNLEVKIQVQPHSQILSLKVSGIRKRVQKAVQVIKTDLDSLVLGKVPLNKVALGEYFSGAGADALNQMAPKCVTRLEIQKRPSRGDEVASIDGNKNQGLAETCWAVIYVVGRKSDMTSFKQEVAKFLAKFYEETVRSSEIPTFGNEVLSDLSKNIPHQFPVAVRHLKETVVQVCGSRKDVENFLEAIYAKIKEATHAKIQKENSDRLESKLLHDTIRWHYRTDAGWSAFDAATNYQLEKAYQKMKTNTKLQWEGKKFQINWLKSEAFMPSRGVTYKLWREVCLWDKNITPHWEAMDQCLVKKVELQRSSEEYQDIVKNFNRTGNRFKILIVERIQNRYLWVSYCWKRSWMEKKNPEGVQNERILYHGTPPENCHSIQEIGFKSACRRGGRYGQGIYFAEDAVLAASYTKLNSCGHRLAFQSRVLTGEYTRGKEIMGFPPMKPGERGYYDSLVDASSKPAIFVIFFDDHAYPEYLITFCESPPDGR